MSKVKSSEIGSKSEQIKHGCDILLAKLYVIYPQYLVEQKSCTKDEMFNYLPYMWTTIHSSENLFHMPKHFLLCFILSPGCYQLYQRCPFNLFSECSNCKKNLNKRHSKQYYLVYTCTQNIISSFIPLQSKYWSFVLP